jgi:hypothetical protein
VPVTDSSFAVARRPLMPEFLSCFLLDLFCKSSATPVRGGVSLGEQDHNGADTEGDDLRRSMVPNAPGSMVRNTNHSQHLAGPVSNAPASRASPQPLSGVPFPTPGPAPVREMRRGQTLHAYTRNATYTCWLLAHVLAYLLTCTCLLAHVCKDFI